MRITLAVLAIAAGCSGSTRTVSGQLDLTTLRPQNGQVVAISSTGQKYRAPISASGAFSIALPANGSYSLRFANATSAAGLYDTFAVLSSARTGKHWFTLGAGGAISLGNITRPAGSTPSGLGTLSESDGSDGSEMEKDDGSEDDGAEVCDLENGKDETAVTSDHDVADDDKGELDDSSSKELDDGAEKPCSAGGDGGSLAAPVPGVK
jgi:hypothetical protein